MLPTLQILWEAACPTKMDASFKEKQELLRACEDKIHAQFGLDFVDELENAWNDLHMAELDCAFEQGFLAAFRLWVEMCSLNGSAMGM